MGSLIAGDKALQATSTRMRKAKVGSCSYVRLVAECDGGRQLLCRYSVQPRVNAEEGVVPGDEVAHLGDDFDHAAGLSGQGGETLEVDGEQDARTAGSGDRLGGGCQDRRVLRGGRVAGCRGGRRDELGVDVLDDGASRIGRPGEHSYRAEFLGQVVDQEEARGDADHGQDDGDEDGQLRDAHANAPEDAGAVHVREDHHEEADLHGTSRQESADQARRELDAASCTARSSIERISTTMVRAAGIMAPRSAIASAGA